VGRLVAHVPPKMARLEPLSHLVPVSSCLLFLLAQYIASL
jgi:hypothetical protein